MYLTFERFPSNFRVFFIHSKTCVMLVGFKLKVNSIGILLFITTVNCFSVHLKLVNYCMEIILNFSY